MTLSVTQLIEVICHALEPLRDVTVEGEVNEFKIKDGKWVLFQLRDDESSLGCFMTAWELNVTLEDGMMVRVQGTPTLRNKGFFSYRVHYIEPAGEGALKRSFELLRQRLEVEGLFAAERKRSLPRFPQRIVLITSRDAAAYSDFIKVLQARQGGLEISFLHTPVQGKDAPGTIVNCLNFATTGLAMLPDVVVLVRGGGGLEDMHAFNDEQVVRAVAGCRVPIIVGVGHERDISLADLAADVRASTPSNAAELLVKSRELLEQEIDSLQERLRVAVFDQLKQQQLTIGQLMLILHGEVRTMKHGLAQLERVLLSLSPAGVLKRGYSITLTADRKLLKRASQTKLGEQITTRLSFGEIDSTVSRRE